MWASSKFHGFHLEINLRPHPPDGPSEAGAPLTRSKGRVVYAFRHRRGALQSLLGALCSFNAYGPDKGGSRSGVL